MYRSQVQIPSPRPLTPSSCLRAECIKSDAEEKPPEELPTHVSARNASLRRVPLYVPSRSQLMSPRGMHPARTLQRMTAATAPNSCLRAECIAIPTLALIVHSAPNSCLRAECIFLKCWDCFALGLPTHVSARNASTGNGYCLETTISQLMSPHEMHPTQISIWRRNQCSQLMSPHEMHLPLLRQQPQFFDSQLMSPHEMHPLRQRTKSPSASSQLMSPHEMHQQNTPRNELYVWNKHT